MIKVLIRKELLAFVSRLIPKRKKASVVGGIVIFLLIYLVILIYAGSCAVSFLLHYNVMEHISERSYVYFSFMGSISIGIGAFGTALGVYNTLYRAKDNEILLSMPIKLGDIIISRLFLVCIGSFLFSLVAWLPACIFYYILVKCSLEIVIGTFITFIGILILVSGLTGLFGFFFAKISGRITNKKIIPLLFAAVGFALYYYFSFNFANILNNIDKIADKYKIIIDKYLFPLKVLGLGGNSILCAIFFILISIIIALICAAIVKSSFLRIALKKDTFKKEKVDLNKSKINTPFMALIKKECITFTSSTVYFLNYGLGLVMFPVLGIFIMIKGKDLVRAYREINLVGVDVHSIMPLGVLVVLSFLMGLSAMTCCIVSFERNRYWITRSLPIETKNILLSKLSCSLLFFTPSIIISTILIGIGLSFNTPIIILVSILGVLSIGFVEELGLICNLVFPKLDFTNDTEVVKQGLAPALSIFGGMIIISFICFFGIIISIITNTYLGLVGLIIIMGIMDFLLYLYLIKGGKTRYEKIEG